METEERELCFIGEWFDPHPEILKRYLIKYYAASNEVEINDLTTGRKFLKRTRIPASASAATEQDFRIGRHVLLFSRNMKLIEYGDVATEQWLREPSEETVVVVSSKVVNEGELGNVVELMEGSAGLQVVMMKVLRTAVSGVASKSLIVNEELFVLNDDSDGFAVAIVLQGEGSIDKARRTMAGDERYDASSVYCTASTAEAAKAKELLLNPSGPNNENKSAQSSNNDCTCCVIKPHAIKSRNVGGILRSISAAGYDIADLGLFHLDGSAAREFLEVYSGGAVPQLHLVVQEMSSGPVIALRVVRRSSSGEEEGNNNITRDDVVSAFRADVAGPWHVEMARELHPATLRARYGVDNVQNAVHCTDLSCDGWDECQYFEILSVGAA